VTSTPAHTVEAMTGERAMCKGRAESDSGNSGASSHPYEFSLWSCLKCEKALFMRAARSEATEGLGQLSNPEQIDHECTRLQGPRCHTCWKRLVQGALVLLDVFALLQAGQSHVIPGQVPDWAGQNIILQQVQQAGGAHTPCTLASWSTRASVSPSTPCAAAAAAQM